MTYTSPAVRFAATLAATHAAGKVADHWVQTQHQACVKGEAGWRGRLSCAAHVGTYVATEALALVVTDRVTGLGLRPGRVAAALAVTAITHYIADRRRPLRRMADALGKDPAWLDNGGGMYAMDQSWHDGWHLASALIMAGSETGR